jgi:hypothetical protein
VDPPHPTALIVAFSSDERQVGIFEILVDGKRVGEPTIRSRTPEQDPRFFDVEFPIPAEMVQGKIQVFVRFQVNNRIFDDSTPRAKDHGHGIQVHVFMK